jgi:hypothetical protein
MEQRRRKEREAERGGRSKYNRRRDSKKNKM